MQLKSYNLWTRQPLKVSFLKTKLQRVSKSRRLGAMRYFKTWILWQESTCKILKRLIARGQNHSELWVNLKTWMLLSMIRTCKARRIRISLRSMDRLTSSKVWEILPLWLATGWLMSWIRKGVKILAPSNLTYKLWLSLETQQSLVSIIHHSLTLITSPQSTSSSWISECKRCRISRMMYQRCMNQILLTLKQVVY